MKAHLKTIAVVCGMIVTIYLSVSFPEKMLIVVAILFSVSMYLLLLDNFKEKL
jgi:hypothetical protein